MANTSSGLSGIVPASQSDDTSSILIDCILNFDIKHVPNMCYWFVIGKPLM